MMLYVNYILLKKDKIKMFLFTCLLYSAQLNLGEWKQHAFIMHEMFNKTCNKDVSNKLNFFLLNANV